MADIVFIATALVFFGLCRLYVAGCDRIIGREGPGSSAAGGPAPAPATEDLPEAAARS